MHQCALMHPTEFANRNKFNHYKPYRQYIRKAGIIFYKNVFIVHHTLIL